MTYGRDIFKQIFPDGITNASIEALLNQSKFDEKANA